MSYPLADLERRLANLLRVGTVEEVDHNNALARVQLGNNHTVALPWLTQRAGGDRTWWPVEVGEQVVILSPSGDLTQGIILGALYSGAASAPSSSAGVYRTEYSDGAVIQYDRNTHQLTADIPGDVSVTANGNISAQAGGDITATAVGNITGTAGDTISLDATNIILSAGLIRLAGPMVAAGRNGESYSAAFYGPITHKNGDYTNESGDVVAEDISLKKHTHTEQGDLAETSTPN